MPMVTLAEIYAAMGYGSALPDPQTAEVVETLLPQAVEVARPQYVYHVYPASQVDRRHIQIKDIEFEVGGIICSYLDGMTHACTFVATAGLEYDRWLNSIKQEKDILYEYVADSIGSVIAESAVDRLSEELDSSELMKHSLPYSPGYCAWNVSDQHKLFSLLPEKRCGVTLTESCLMHPVKSVSGFFALGKELVPQPYRCDLCTNKNCFKNRK